MVLFLTILIVIASLLLVLIVVIQNSKGGGLASSFSSSNQVMGVRKTTDFLEKVTWYLAGTVVVLCVLTTVFMHPGQRTDLGIDTESVQQTIEQEPIDIAPFESSDIPVAPETPPAE